MSGNKSQRGGVSGQLLGTGSNVSQIERILEGARALFASVPTDAAAVVSAHTRGARFSAAERSMSGLTVEQIWPRIQWNDRRQPVTATAEHSLLAAAVNYRGWWGSDGRTRSRFSSVTRPGTVFDRPQPIRYTQAVLYRPVATGSRRYNGTTSILYQPSVWLAGADGAVSVYWDIQRRGSISVASSTRPDANLFDRLCCVLVNWAAHVDDIQLWKAELDGHKAYTLADNRSTLAVY